MLDANKALLTNNYSHFGPDRTLTAQNWNFSDTGGPTSASQPFLPQSMTAAGKTVGFVPEANVLINFPQFEATTWIVHSDMSRIGELSESNGYAEWVAQLRSNDPTTTGFVIYALFFAPPDWNPPPYCDATITENLPIARGVTDEAGGINTIQVLYTISSGLHCIDPTLKTAPTVSPVPTH